MKIIVSEELKSRLTNASSNGSIIARDILAELKKNVDVSDIIRGNANYFSTKRKKTGRFGMPKNQNSIYCLYQRPEQSEFSGQEQSQSAMVSRKQNRYGAFHIYRIFQKSTGLRA